jgi:hypothetical protein
MKHLGTPEEDVERLVQATLQNTLATAQKDGLCPNCLLSYMSAYVVANILLRGECVVRGVVNEKEVGDMLSAMSEAAVNLAIDLETRGYFWEPGQDNKPNVH